MGQKLIDLIGNPYADPYCAIRSHSSWPDLTNPLHVALLLADFDTEVSMNGILGFLENSTGAYLEQTIGALRIVGAEQTASVLSQIRDAMKEFGVSHERLRSAFHSATKFQVVAFSQLHPGIEEFSHQIQQHARSLYLYDESQESPFLRLEAYLNRCRAAFLAELQRTNVGPSSV